jgi:hypothetical protein
MAELFVRRLAVWNVDDAASVAAHLARAEVSTVAVRAVYFLARPMLREMRSGWASAIAFGLLLGHHMVAHWTEPQIFSFSHVRILLRRRSTLSGIAHFCA